MVNTLDDVIEACKRGYELEVTNENKTKYLGFLKRQLKAHPEYDLNKQTPHPKGKIFPYLNLMRDKLLLFSYLIGETMIIAGYNEEGWDKKYTEEKRIESVDDLYLLRPKELGGGGAGRLRGEARKKALYVNQTDEALLSVYCSFTNKAHKYTEIWMSWGKAIDELGEDSEIVKHLKQKITYKMIKACESPNPHTATHGRYRRVKKKSQVF